MYHVGYADRKGIPSTFAGEMRSLVVLFILFNCHAYSQAFDQDIVTKATRESIKKNNIRFIMGWSYSFTNNVMSRQGKKSSFEKFDKEGFLIEEVFYNVAGGVNYECTHDYNKLGLEASRIFINAKQYQTRRWVYKQNEKTGELEAWPTHSFGSQEHTAYRFDPYGRKVQETRYDRDGLVSTIFIKYDDNGNVVEKLELDGNNNLYSKRLYTYDSSGNCTQAVEYDAENKLFLIYNYEYDQSGNKISETTVDAAGNTKQKIKFIYQPFTW